MTNGSRPIVSQECAPKPDTKVVTVDTDEPVCGSITVATKTTTTAYVWNAQSESWDEGTPVVTTGTRPLTENEKAKLAAELHEGRSHHLRRLERHPMSAATRPLTKPGRRRSISYTYDANKGLFLAGNPVWSPRTSLRTVSHRQGDGRRYLSPGAATRRTSPRISVTPVCGYDRRGHPHDDHDLLVHLRRRDERVGVVLGHRASCSHSTRPAQRRRGRLNSMKSASSMPILGSSIDTDCGYYDIDA